MSLRIGVSHPIHLLAKGLAGLLEDAGHEVGLIDDLQDLDALDVVVVSDAPELLLRLQRLHPGLTVVALVGDVDPATFERAFAAGARGVVAESWTDEETVETIEGTAAGKPPVPFEVVQHMATRSTTERTALTDVEMAIITGLVKGLRVWEIAVEIGYSERHTYRFIADLLRHLGVSSRAEAIARAAQLQLISPTQ